MKRTRAQNPKAQDQEPPQDPVAVAGSNPNPKPQRRAKQPRQPKAAAATAGKKSAAAREAAAAVATAAAAALSPAAEMAPVVPDVGAGGGGEVACGLPAEWDEMDGSPWWTFGVEEEKLLGWFPFVEEDFRSVGVGGPAGAEPAAFDDDIWRIHQIYEIPSYAAK